MDHQQGKSLSSTRDFGSIIIPLLQALYGVSVAEDLLRQYKIKYICFETNDLAKSRSLVCSVPYLKLVFILCFNLCCYWLWLWLPKHKHRNYSRDTLVRKWGKGMLTMTLHYKWIARIWKIWYSWYEQIVYRIYMSKIAVLGRWNAWYTRYKRFRKLTEGGRYVLQDVETKKYSLRLKLRTVHLCVARKDGPQTLWMS